MTTCRSWLLAAATAFLNTTMAAPITYPDTPKIAHTDTYFGTEIQDPYHWLEDDNSTETKAWVARQNALTFGWLGKIPFRADLLARIRAISNYAKYSVPFQKNGFVYFYKNDGLQNQSALYVQKGLDGTPELLLDPNTFSADGTTRLESFTLSRDGRYAVVAKSAIPGSDWQDFQVMDMATRQMLPEVLHWIKFSGPQWRGDGFYYSRFPEPVRGTELTAPTEGQSVWFHKVGTPQSVDTPVYEDKAHPDYFVDVSTTEDERFAVLTVQNRKLRGNSLFVRDETKPEKSFRPVVPELSEDRFDLVGSDGEQLLIRSNRGAPNYELMSFDTRKHLWTTVLPEQPHLLESVQQAGGRLFTSYLQDVSSHVQMRALDGSLLKEIALPAPGTAVGFGGEAKDTEVFYSFTSMNQPPTLFRYDIAKARSAVFRAPEIPGFDPARFESRQVFFKSRDGTRVPMFIVNKKGLALDGRNPTILYGYGGFDISLTPYFSPSRIAWLEQGGVFAMANLRGGGEYGEAWHQAGMRLNKQNVFDDCIAAAEYLIGEKITSPDRLVLQGGSNGGLLVGAVINQRPDLFKVGLPQVGVMDMLRFQKFSVGSAWISDYGSSDDEKQFRYLLGYSPLHNLKAGRHYPAMLITTSDHDDRVVPAHSFKYAAALQALSGPDDPPHLIRIATNSGHGSSNLSKALEEVADSYAFAWANMGITPVFPPAPAPASSP
jgi:prolyl oligopeptidase